MSNKINLPTASKQDEILKEVRKINGWSQDGSVVKPNPESGEYIKLKMEVESEIIVPHQSQLTSGSYERERKNRYALTPNGGIGSGSSSRWTFSSGAYPGAYYRSLSIQKYDRRGNKTKSVSIRIDNINLDSNSTMYVNYFDNLENFDDMYVVSIGTRSNSDWSDFSTIYHEVEDRYITLYKGIDSRGSRVIRSNSEELLCFTTREAEGGFNWSSSGVEIIDVKEWERLKFVNVTCLDDGRKKGVIKSIDLKNKEGKNFKISAFIGEYNNRYYFIGEESMVFYVFEKDGGEAVEEYEINIINKRRLAGYIVGDYVVGFSSNHIFDLKNNKFEEIDGLDLDPERDIFVKLEDSLVIKKEGSNNKVIEFDGKTGEFRQSYSPNLPHLHGGFKLKTKDFFVYYRQYGDSGSRVYIVDNNSLRIAGSGFIPGGRNLLFMFMEGDNLMGAISIGKVVYYVRFHLMIANEISWGGDY